MTNARQNIAERGPFDAFNDDVSDPVYSPSLSAPFGIAYGLPAEVATHVNTAANHDGQWWGASADTDYIKPSEGGKAGPGCGLGWTTGLRSIRERRAAFDGRTLVIPPGQANNPASGPVGRDTRADRLGAGVTALGTDFLPSMDQIAGSFVNPRRSMIVREMLEQ